jgi:hypothetical protein
MDMQSPVFESGGGRFIADDDEDEDEDVHRNPLTLRGRGTAVLTGNFDCAPFGEVRERPNRTHCSRVDVGTLCLAADLEQPSMGPRSPSIEGYIE